MSDEEDNSVEGAITRQLFRSESDSSEDEGRSHQQQRHNSSFTVETRPSHSSPIIREIDCIQLEEVSLQASIAQRLWPSAEFLAHFVRDVATENLAPSQRMADQECEAALRSLQDILKCRPERKDSLPSPAFAIIELGAGLGFTGLWLASQLPCRVLLTDVSEALPLLERNILRNRDSFVCGPDAVKAQRLDWTCRPDSESALQWYGADPEIPLLVLGSDVVYYEELHNPLEETLNNLLSTSCSTKSSATALIAGVRRWKRDTAFFERKLGRRGRTTAADDGKTGRLRCSRLVEIVHRQETSTQRDIQRIYCIKWVQGGEEE